MAHKATPRRTGVMKKQIVKWSFQKVLKVPKGAKGNQKELVAVHTPPAW